ncbi:MAG: hypothetical protein JWN37_494 [Candidatus Nomurabacteria bacterium]|nr:hypothetical protein [Candidatus Nomurabacteria bacterium]
MYKLVIGILVVVALALALDPHYQQYKADKQELAEHRQQMQWRVGYSQLVGDYKLLSLDGGKMWYAAETKDKAIIIQGRAEDVYPGILSQTAGMEAAIQQRKELQETSWQKNTN